MLIQAGVRCSQTLRRVKPRRRSRDSVPRSARPHRPGRGLDIAFGSPRYAQAGRGYTYPSEHPNSGVGTHDTRAVIGRSSMELGQPRLGDPGTGVIAAPEEAR